VYKQGVYTNEECEKVVGHVNRKQSKDTLAQSV